MSIVKIWENNTMVIMLKKKKTKNFQVRLTYMKHEDSMGKHTARC